MAKGPDAFRTISEASTEVGVPQHVLRFWETRFAFVRPMKGAGGRRFYRRQDVEVLKAVRELLHGRGLSIKAVSDLHRRHGARGLLSAEPASAAPKGGEVDVFGVLQAELHAPLAEPRPGLEPSARAKLGRVLSDLEEVRARLDHLLAGRRSV